MKNERWGGDFGKTYREEVEKAYKNWAGSRTQKITRKIAYGLGYGIAMAAGKTVNLAETIFRRKPKAPQK